MVTSVSYATLSVLLIIIAAGSLGSYVGNGFKDEKLKNFSLVFFFLSIYEFLLSYFLFFDDLYMAAWSYNFAIVVIFIVFMLVINIASEIVGMENYNRRFIYFIIIFAGILAVGMQIYDFKLPIMRGGIVDWNTNGLAAKITSLSAFMVSIFWSYAILKNISSFESFHKPKAIALALGGFFMGLSGLTAYHNYEVGVVIVSHSFAFAGGMLILGALFIFNKNKSIKS